MNYKFGTECHYHQGNGITTDQHPCAAERKRSLHVHCQKVGVISNKKYIVGFIFRKVKVFNNILFVANKP